MQVQVSDNILNQLNGNIDSVIEYLQGLKKYNPSYRLHLVLKRINKNGLYESEWAVAVFGEVKESKDLPDQPTCL